TQSTAPSLPARPSSLRAISSAPAPSPTVPDVRRIRVPGVRAWHTAVQHARMTWGRRHFGRQRGRPAGRRVIAARALWSKLMGAII
ncbi:MAG: hypothetical protein M1830_010610, partial [Pleopsidium flavum]